MSLTLTRRYNVDRFGYLIPTRYGNVPMMGVVATYRPDEGRFGGAVAVEEGTTNKHASEGGGAAQNWSLWNHWGFRSYWQSETQYDDPAMGKVYEGVKAATGNNTYLFDYYSYTYQAGVAYTGSIYLKADRHWTGPLRFYLNHGGNQALGDLTKHVTLDTQWRRFEFTLVPTAASSGEGGMGWMFIGFPVGAKLYAAKPQFEQKPFATSFVDGTRPDGILAYPIVLKDDYTIACYRKSHTDEDYKHVVKRSDGKVFVDGVEDSEYDVGWIGGRNLLEGNWDLTWEDSHPGYQYLLRPRIQSILGKVSIGDTLTFSFDVEAEADTSLRVYDVNGHPGISFGSQSIDVKQGKQRVSFTKTLVAGSKNMDVWYMDVYNENNGVKFSISKIKIEKGNKATDWTPAPEDLGYGGDALMLSNQTGLVDELLVLPYAASEEEIVSWYEAQGPLPPHPQASLQWDRQMVRPAQMVKL